VVGIAIIIGIILLMIRKRRASVLDKEITAAAYEANIQAGRNNAAINEMDWEDQYPPSSGTHGIYNQQPLPSGPSAAYDPFGESAYPMRSRRFSQQTISSAGIAGLGARGTNAGNPLNGGVPSGERYATGPRGEQYQKQSSGDNQGGYHTTTGSGTAEIGRMPSQRNGPSGGLLHEQPPYNSFVPYPSQGAYGAQQQQHAGPSDPYSGAPRPQSGYSQEYDTPYAGVEEYDDEHHEQGVPHLRDAERDRMDSMGSLREDNYHDEDRRVLKVTN